MPALWRGRGIGGMRVNWQRGRSKQNSERGNSSCQRLLAVDWATLGTARVRREGVRVQVRTGCALRRATRELRASVLAIDNVADRHRTRARHCDGPKIVVAHQLALSQEEKKFLTRQIVSDIPTARQQQPPQRCALRACSQLACTRGFAHSTSPPPHLPTSLPRHPLSCSPFMRS